MTLSVWAGLIGMNLIWSAHPLMSKWLLETVSPLHAAWFRYAGALVAYVLAAAVFRRRLPQPFIAPALTRAGWPDWGWAAALGFASFCFSPLLQMSGLNASRATDNAILIALEPLITVFLAWVVYGDPLNRGHLFAFGGALAGFVLLSGLTWARVSQGFDGPLWGNCLMLISLTGEAAYSILGRKLVGRYPASGIFGTALVIGSLILTAVVFARAGLPHPGNLTARGWVAVLWLGPLGTSLAYLFWMVALRDTSIANISLTLFVQPLMGAVWGVVFLGEKLNPLQASGALLILFSVLVVPRVAERVRK